MEFEFILPKRIEDLLESSGNSYCVSRVSNENDCIEKLRREFFVYSVVLVKFNFFSLQSRVWR